MHHHLPFLFALAAGVAAEPPRESDATARPIPHVAAAIESNWLASVAWTRVAHLLVTGAPASASVRVTCTGPSPSGCPFKAKLLTAPAGTAQLLPLVEHAELRPGTMLEIQVTAAGMIGKVVRYTMRKGAFPSTESLCLPPGATDPSPC